MGLDEPRYFGISIHALLAESDIIDRAGKPPEENFYPRSPCGERPSSAPSFRSRVNFYPRSPCGERPAYFGFEFSSALFLSTLSLRRATSGRWILPRRSEISIHALLAESDAHIRTDFGEHGYFYPRSPCGERRSLHRRAFPNAGISIHALLAESDRVVLRVSLQLQDFYPRSPCGERQRRSRKPIKTTSFLSTLSLRRATCKHCFGVRLLAISIHALLAESDGKGYRPRQAVNIFLSTLSLRRATLP